MPLLGILLIPDRGLNPHLLEKRVFLSQKPTFPFTLSQAGKGRALEPRNPLCHEMGFGGPCLGMGESQALVTSQSGKDPLA